MLWDPGSVKKDEEEEQDNVSITPILVPLQNKSLMEEKGVPVLVPDVQDLKDQFQQQQNMLTQIKETLKKNESQLSSKGKQMEVYANKLSQIRARSKNNQGRKPSSLVSPTSPKVQKKLLQENLRSEEYSESEKPSESHSRNRKEKVFELRKCLEENKIKLEQRTGKEQSETKKIESLVEQLKLQLEERDRTIQGLQKTIEEPTPRPECVPKSRQKQKDSMASKTTQTIGSQPSDDSTEVIALQKKIHELEVNVLDLEENLKEKESVIEARTQAVALLSQDMSLKGKSTLESLEETRQEMRAMQNNFIAIEDQLKRDLADRNSRLAALEDKYRKLESANFELSLRNAEQQEKLVNLQRQYLEIESERKSLKESLVQGQSPDKLDELTKKINVLTKELDERNKAMIKMKIEHKKKMKNVNKTLETLKGASEEKSEIVRLSSALEELELVKTGLENRVAELEDEKASEAKLREQVKGLELVIEEQSERLGVQSRRISSLEKEKSDLVGWREEQSIVIGNLEKHISSMEAGVKAETDKDRKLKELSQKVEVMEEEYKEKVEELKGEHKKALEMLESYYGAKGESLDRKALEEYRISAEMSNIHVEEQIELLIREKQQLLEKLKGLSGVSSMDSLTFEKMEHSDLKDYRELVLPLGENVEMASEENRAFHLEKIVSEQQHLVNELEKTIGEEKERVRSYQERISELESTMRDLEDANVSLKQQIEMTEGTESGKNTKTNTNTKNRIKKIEMELTQSKKTVEEQSEKLEELRLKLQEKEDLIGKYSERIELFEKDDWDRQNQWKNAEDEIDSVQELQKKCLSLENSLYELNEDCERLRKENIEVVHLLSEEKVKRRKLLEELEARAVGREGGEGEGEAGVERRVRMLSQALEELEGKVERLEGGEVGGGWGGGAEWRGEGVDGWEVRDLQEKLEWTNVVLTSKETEMFRLQSLLEDRNKAIEILEADAKELRRKLGEREKSVGDMAKELKAKEAQLEEISANFERLQDSVNVTNEKTATNESQLKELLSSVREMEGDVFRKESELEEIKGILAEKNLDMTNLRNRLEEVNSDLTYSYQEHLENMGKCLRDKETELEALLAEKSHLEGVNRKLVEEKEEMQNEKEAVRREKEGVEVALLEREKLVRELEERLKGMEGPNEEKEALKVKMKKLAANLKKKAQNEADLMRQVKELEESVSEKEKRVEGLEWEVKGVTEKWMNEKTEKEKAGSELAAALAEKAAAEALVSETRERVDGLGKALEEARLEAARATELERQIQEVKEAYLGLQVVEREDKGKISDLEGKLAELCEQRASAASAEERKEMEAERTRQGLLQELAEERGRHEEVKARCEELVLERAEMGRRLDEAQRAWEESLSEKSSLEAKMQEKLAVIETLEAEVKKVEEQMKKVEEKFFLAEDRRQSLERKNEEMREKLMENSENLTAMDDLSVRIDELLKSEKVLQNSVRDLQSGNAELKEALEQIVTEKHHLEMELKASSDKLSETGAELRELRSADEEKSSSIRELTEAVERLKTEKKQLSSEFERLNRDYEQFEVDFKENLEKWENVERCLRHRMEELVSENARLSEECEKLSEEGPGGEAKGGERRKKRRSVAFGGDEEECGKEVRGQVEGGKEGKEGEDAGDVRERAEGREEQTFDGRMFFGAEGEEFLGGKGVEGQQGSELEALMWDDGWGAEGNLEADYLSGKEVESGKLEVRVKALEAELRSAEGDNERLRKELEEQSGKYTKALRKLKELKGAYEKVQSEARKLKGGGDFGGLEAAMVEELKCQIEGMEAKERELMKSLENSKVEREGLLKRIEVLNAGNEKFLEMKERQDNEVEIWQRKNSELLREIAELRQEQVGPRVPDDNALLRENEELRNKVEALEWENCELVESLEEKQELLEGRAQASENHVERVMREKSELQKEVEELNLVRERLEKRLSDEGEKSSMAIGELNEQLTALASENEALQGILGEMKKSADAARQQERAEESKVFDYFRASPGAELFSAAVSSSQEQALGEAEGLRQRVWELEVAVQQKEEEGRKRWEEVQWLRERVSELEVAVQQKEEEGRKRWEEVQWLRERVSEAEEGARRAEAQREGERLRVEEVEGLVGRREEELEMRRVEVEVLRGRVGELERGVAGKEEELSRVVGRVRELEERYEDSKGEMERVVSEGEVKVEEKFVEPLENKMEVPEALEVEGLSRRLREEELRCESLLCELSEKENALAVATAQIENLNRKLREVEDAWKESREGESAWRELKEESVRVKGQLEKVISELQKELESSKLQLSVAERELEEFQKVKDGAVAGLEWRLFELETALAEAKERERTASAALRNELSEKGEYYEALMREGRGELESTKEAVRELEQSKKELEKGVEALKEELEEREREVVGLGRRLQEEGSRVGEMREVLKVREGEVAELKDTLRHLQEEMGHFRDFEKQVKDLRIAQMKEGGSEVTVTAEGLPDLSDWTEHELSELNSRLQSDLDTALYMLHQRDVRCDELTFELMQLLEERDTLQLRLSTALRINEGLRTITKPEARSSTHTLEESKDLVDQSNDRQPDRSRLPGEDLQQLADKISELHSVSYLRDKTVKDESAQRHKEQMNLLSRVSDSDITLSRDFQSSPAVLLNWMRGKTTPKVMHI